MKKLIDNFFAWYNKHLTLNIAIATFLFALQLIHLYWLGTDVIAKMLTGRSYFELTGLWKTLILLVDYTEIPALITTSLIYVNQLRNKFNYKSLLFIFLLLSQFLHIFWITDEFVIEQFSGVATTTHLPHFVAWIAILIDYLEVPVIIDTTRMLIVGLKKGDKSILKEAFKED